MYDLDLFSELYETAIAKGFTPQEFKAFYCGELRKSEQEFNSLAHLYCDRRDACQNAKAIASDGGYEPIWEIAKYDGHILVACRTGAGKTTTAQAAVKLAYCNDPQWVDFSIFDPKGSYFLGFEQDDSKYIFANGVHAIPKVIDRLDGIMTEMQRRQAARFANRGRHPKPLKRIIVLLDEFNNLRTYAKLYDQKANAELERGQAKSRTADQLIEIVTLLINMGREDLINVWLFGQSHLVKQLGLDTSIQDNVAFFCQGRDGDYESIEAAIADHNVVAYSKTRESLNQQLAEMRESPLASQTPLVFSTLGGKKLRFLGDLRSIKDEQIYWAPPKQQQPKLLMPVLVPQSISPDLERIIEFSIKKGWVSASAVKAGVRSFRDSSTADIRAMFYQLTQQGIGAIRGDGEAIEYNRYPQGS